MQQTKKRRYSVAILALAVVFALSTVGTTWAAWAVEDPSVHVINTASVTGRIVEEYTAPTALMPGVEVTKIVNVQNVGTIDCLVRVRVTKTWGTQRDADGVLVVDETIPTDNILISFNDTDWFYDEADGYFYYQHVLSEQEITNTPLFESFTIDEQTGNEYAGLTADITVRLECVQAAADGVTVWDKTLEELGITYTQPPQEIVVTRVLFRNTTQGFAFEPEDTDLFSNFKFLVPGDVRTQTMEVYNGFDTPVEIFLRADYIEQSQATQETLRLIEELLQEDAYIQVRTTNGNLLYDGPIWGEPFAEDGTPGTQTFKDNVSLGIFRVEETKELQITLTISKDMDNEYKELQGLIRWIWSAQGALDEPGVTTPTEPGVTTPTEPGVTTPTEPGVTTPTEPGVTTPTEPGVTTPTEPGVTTPTEPGVTTPTEPGVTTPTEPGVTTPTEPGGTTPTEPGGTTPTEPGVTTPTEPGVTTPTEPSVTTPTEPGGITPTEPGESTTKGESGPPTFLVETPVDIPKTGVESKLYVYAASMAVSGVALLILLTRMKKLLAASN